MLIGTIDIPHPIVLAPMAGITDRAFRAIARLGGAALAYTEMISAAGLVRSSAKTFQYLSGVDKEPLTVVQLFGADPAEIAEAGAIAVANGAAMIDLNGGCSVRKIVSRGAGAALLRDRKLMVSIAERLVRAVRIPVLVKTRLGWDSTAPAVSDLAVSLADAGVNAIAVHGRTATQEFRGHADWTAIASIARRSPIPIIGNGDIGGPLEAAQRLAESGCAGVMIGRAARGNPSIFAQAAAAVRGGAIPAGPSLEERAVLIRQHAVLAAEGGAMLPFPIRKHLHWYLREIPGAKTLRRAVNECRTLEDLDKILRHLGAQRTLTPDPSASEASFR